VKSLCALALVAGAAHADPAVSVGPVAHYVTNFIELGARVSAGSMVDGGVSGWRVDAQYTTDTNPGHAHSTSLRVGWLFGSRSPSSSLVFGTQIAAGADIDSFAGEDGYTDGALYAVIGSEARVTATLSTHVFLAGSVDANLRPFHAGNNHSNDTVTFDLGLWLGVR
jgi:hypothetical protein